MAALRIGPLNIVREHRMASLANPSSQMFDAFGVSSTYAGERVTSSTMIQEAAVYSAIRQISEAVGQSPFSVYRRFDDDTREEARQHRTWGLLHDKPNSNTPARHFWAAVAAQLLVWENVFIRKDRSDAFGPVDELYLMDPSGAVIDIDREGRRTFTWYTPTKVTYGADRILHIPGFSLDGIVGTPRSTLCKQTLATTLARAKFEGTFYARGGKPAGWIGNPGRLGDAGTKRLAENFQQWHGGQHHKFPVLEEGATLNEFGMSMADMQFVELRQLSVTEIATMFQMPASRLNAGVGDDLTYKNTESDGIQFVIMAVNPLATRIAHSVTHDPEMLPQNVMYARFNTDVNYMADGKGRAETWQILADVLGLDPEYIAGKENIPADALKPPEKPAPVAPVVPAPNGNGAVDVPAVVRPVG